MNPSFEDLTEEIQDFLKPPLFRSYPPKEMTPIQEEWRENGVVILRNVIPHELIDAYCSRFIADRVSESGKLHSSPVTSGKWRPNTSYMDAHEILDLCLYPPLMQTMSDLISQEMALHLNLCEWVSTERDWHADDYLNPHFVNNHYCAAWFALDDITLESGPFEYIRGSHKWPLMRRELVFRFAPQEMRDSPEWNSHWPSMTQGFVSDACESKIRQEDAPVSVFYPANKGDVLLWSGALIHRGSAPTIRGTERRALISHYSSIKHRLDMPRVATYSNQSKYFYL